MITALIALILGLTILLFYLTIQPIADHFGLSALHTGILVAATPVVAYLIGWIAELVDGGEWV